MKPALLQSNTKKKKKNHYGTVSLMNIGAKFLKKYEQMNPIMYKKK